MVNSPDSLRPVQNLVIHINLNCYAEFPPPLQGAQRPQRGRDGVGGSDIGWCPKMYAASNKSVVDIEKSDGKCFEVIGHLLGKTAGFAYRAAYPLA